MPKTTLLCPRFFSDSAEKEHILDIFPNQKQNTVGNNSTQNFDCKNSPHMQNIIRKITKKTSPLCNTT